MRLSPWAFAPIITAVYAADIQVNYYSDGGCANWLVDVYPFDGSCYGYKWSGTNSANIAACSAPEGYNCACTFWTQDDCTGAAQIVTYGQGQEHCASNWGQGFVSMQCGMLEV